MGLGVCWESEGWKGKGGGMERWVVGGMGGWLYLYRAAWKENHTKTVRSAKMISKSIQVPNHW